MKIFWYVIPLLFQVSGEICEVKGEWVRDKKITTFTRPQLLWGVVLFLCLSFSVLNLQLPAASTGYRLYWRISNIWIALACFQIVPQLIIGIYFGYSFTLFLLYMVIMRHRICSILTAKQAAIKSPDVYHEHFLPKCSQNCHFWKMWSQLAKEWDLAGSWREAVCLIHSKTEVGKQ